MAHNMPVLHTSSGLQINKRDGYGDHAKSFFQNNVYSLFYCSALCNTLSSSPRPLPEFYNHTTIREYAATVSLAGKEFSTLFTDAVTEISDLRPFAQSELANAAGHKHGTRDQDDGLFWQEL